MIRVGGTYEFNVIGDGETTQISIPMAALRTPEPFVAGQLPTKLGMIQIVNGEGTVTGEWSDESKTRLVLMFSVPPSRDIGTRVMIEALFGGE